MNKKFSQYFDIIYKKYSERVVAMGCTPSVLAFSKFLGYDNDGKPKNWKKGQWPSRDDCSLLCDKLGFNLNWLLTGEGEVLLNSPNYECATTDAKGEIEYLRRRITDLEKVIAAQEEALGLYRAQVQRPLPGQLLGPMMPATEPAALASSGVRESPD
jgi:hypothetical protein